MKTIINALLASMIVIPAPGMLPETPVTYKLVMIITERNKRRLIAKGKYSDLLT